MWCLKCPTDNRWFNRLSIYAVWGANIPKSLLLFFINLKFLVEPRIYFKVSICTYIYIYIYNHICMTFFLVVYNYCQLCTWIASKGLEMNHVKCMSTWLQQVHTLFVSFNTNNDLSVSLQSKYLNFSLSLHVRNSYGIANTPTWGWMVLLRSPIAGTWWLAFSQGGFHDQKKFFTICNNSILCQSWFCYFATHENLMQIVTIWEICECSMDEEVSGCNEVCPSSVCPDAVLVTTYE